MLTGFTKTLYSTYVFIYFNFLLSPRLDSIGLLWLVSIVSIDRLIRYSLLDILTCLSATFYTWCYCALLCSWFHSIFSQQHGASSSSGWHAEHCYLNHLLLVQIYWCLCSRCSEVDIPYIPVILVEVHFSISNTSLNFLFCYICNGS